MALTRITSRMVTFLHTATGAVTRFLRDRLAETVSVKDFGAVGDGVADDTAAIQAAIDTTKKVYFPSGTYKTTAKLLAGYHCRLIGDGGATRTKIVRSGGGTILEFAQTNEYSLIENITFDGAGASAIKGYNGGYADYISTLTLRDCHFTKELAICLDANFIYLQAVNCTFGYYGSVANASHRHIKSWFSGGNYTNLCRVVNCKFFSGAAAQASVDLNAGMQWRFEDCDWTLCGQLIKAVNMSGLVLDNCYSEQCVHATAQIDVATSRTRVKILGGNFLNGGSTPCFLRYSDDTPVLLQDVDLSLGATSYVLTNATSGAHTLPGHGRVRVTDCRIQGNNSDPLKANDSNWSSLMVPKAWGMINTAGAGTIIAASDPGMYLGRNGTGDCNVGFTGPLGSGPSTLCVTATGQNSQVIAFGIANSSTIRVIAAARGSTTGVDDIIQFVVWGK